MKAYLQNSGSVWIQKNMDILNDLWEKGDPHMDKKLIKQNHVLVKEKILNVLDEEYLEWKNMFKI